MPGIQIGISLAERLTSPGVLNPVDTWEEMTAAWETYTASWETYG